MNKESIFRQLEQRIAGRALTAEALGEFNAMAIADSLKQKRSIISHHLNNLHREQRVVKVNGRPVLFLPVTVLRDHHRLAVRHGEYASIQALCAERQDSLAQLIGAQGSLQEALRQCKAAISYPGAGLPLLLRGPTGTGKSFLARQLWHYAIDEGILPADAPFTVFNCAEYANNPELLTSKLFGHAKGPLPAPIKPFLVLSRPATVGCCLSMRFIGCRPKVRKSCFILWITVAGAGLGRAPMSAAPRCG